MSTILNTNGASLEIPQFKPFGSTRFYVITAEWNTEITHALRDGATEVLMKGGIGRSEIVHLSVPGTVELINAASLAMKDKDTAAVILIGCVIRGDTPHFDYVCRIAAEGVSILNSRGESPVIFGVLTVDNLKQARERAGGALGNKGAEAAVAAIEMANIHSAFWKSQFV